MPDAIPSWLRIGADSLTLEVVVRPGSQRTGILRIEDRGLVIGVGSAAEKGRANAELIAAIAGIAGVGRGAVSLLRGPTSRTKVIRIGADAPAMIADRIIAAISRSETKVNIRRIR